MITILILLLLLLLFVGLKVQINNKCNIFHPRATPMHRKNNYYYLDRKTIDKSC